MTHLEILPPVSLYIHLPWCISKCPYCDFNSHALKDNLPEALYIQALLDEFEHQHHWLQHRPLHSIFFGGGTPSLFSARALDQLLNGIARLTQVTDDTEITLEANPGAIDESKFRDYRQIGINRLSLGVQSLNDVKLNILGRIHDSTHVRSAITSLKKAGFHNFNLDIMYGLPQQTLSEALDDLNAALAFEPTHFSWYQLTLEPNTLFYRTPPALPNDDLCWDIQQQGQAILKKEGWDQYEVSAYAQLNARCHHNLNYWEYGDYLGIGAGAHSKITDKTAQHIIRFAQVKHPKDYLIREKRLDFVTQIPSKKDIAFEFMLNALRLKEGINTQLFLERTGLSLEDIEPMLQKAYAKGLLVPVQSRIVATALGQQYLNDLTGLFL